MSIASPDRRVRRGISLLEVLVSIGILAIGLTSIVALVPAGRSQASRAVILDRASGLAANLLADAATFGLLRPDALTTGAVATIIDPIDPAGLQLSPLSSGTLRTQGVFATSGAAAPAACQRLFTQSRDDILVNGTASSDDAPLNLFQDNARAFEGRMSGLLCLTPGANNTGTLSAIVFHGRDIGLLSVSATSRDNGLLSVSATIQNGGVDIANLTTAIGSGRTARDVLRPGVVVYANSGFHQVVAASFLAPTPTTGTAYLSFSTGTALMTGTISATILPDSVGLAERPFTYEYDSPYTQ